MNKLTDFFHLSKVNTYCIAVEGRLQRIAGVVVMQQKFGMS